MKTLLDYINEDFKISKNTKYRVKIKVEWDLDDEDLENDENMEDIDLPEIVEVPNHVEDDEIDDYLTDKYGFCVKSWKVVD